MTQIQASVQVTDKVDSNIERKIEQIGNASAKSATQLSNLQNAIKNLQSQPLTTISTAFNSLGRTNLSNLQQQMQRLTQLSTQLGSSFSSQSLAVIKLQIAQTKLQQEQTKLQIVQQKLQTASVQTANAQARGAVTSANLANAQARSATATTRLAIAQQQLIGATARATTAQQRLTQVSEQQSARLDRLAGSTMSFVGSLAVLGAGMGTVISVMSKADAYQSMINKLTLVTESADEARDRLSTLTRVALDSYSGLDSTVQLYTRLHLALKQSGGSASEAVSITRTLSRATALAGLSTAEANSALLQISQAFNKGKLDGDEFRTVMETMPPLADAIAGRLKVTRGELLKLAPEGKITGQVMKDAVLDMAEVIDDKFAKLTPTISQELQNLTTQAQVYFGSMFKDNGASSALSGAIRLLANNLDTATKFAIALGGALVFASARGGIMYIVNAVSALKTEVMLASTVTSKFGTILRGLPVGLFVAGVTTIIALVDQLFDNAITKTIFPNFEQDQAKARDYVSRLKEIATAQEGMSLTKLRQESNLLAQAQAQLQKEIEDTERNLTKANRTIEQKERSIDKLKKTIESYETEMLGVNEFTERYVELANGARVATSDLARAEQDLIDAKADQSTETQKLEELHQKYTESLKVERQNLVKQVEQIERARDTIKDKTEEDFVANETLRKQREIVEKSSASYDELKKKIKAVENQLRSLLGLDASFEPAMAETQAQVQNKVHSEAVTRLKEQAEQQRKMLTMTEQQRKEYQRRLALEKEFAGKAGDSPDDKKEMQTAIQDLITAESALATKREQEREAERKAREDERKAEQAQEKARREAERAREKQAEQIKRNQEEYDRFVGKLEDEATLLSEGFSNYNKYNELYALRNKLAQKGFEIGEERIKQLKAQIDANAKLRELAKGIADEESRSLAKQKEQFYLKMASISQADTSDMDKQVSFDNVMSDIGVTYDVNQGATAIVQQYEFAYQRLQELRETDVLNAQQYQDAMYALDSSTQDAIYNKRLENLHAMGGMYSVMASAFESFTQNATQSLMGVLNGTQSIGNAMRNLARTILTSVVQAIVQMGVKWIAQQTMQLAFGQTAMATQTALSVAMASTLASAWATPASLVSLASYGANAPPAMAGIQATMATTKAMAIAGARRHGGSVNAGDLYQVGEGNAPEIYQSRSGRQYMIAGDNGRVIPNKNAFGGSSGGVNIVQNVTINGNGSVDPDTLQQFEDRTRSIVYEVLVEQTRDAGGMLA